MNAADDHGIGARGKTLIVARIGMGLARKKDNIQGKNRVEPQENHDTGKPLRQFHGTANSVGKKRVDREGPWQRVYRNEKL